MKTILVESSIEPSSSNDGGGDNNNAGAESANDVKDDDKLKIETHKIKEILSELIECFSNSAIVDLYTSLLFDPTDPIEYTRNFLFYFNLKTKILIEMIIFYVFAVVEDVFRDCLIYCLKSIGFHKIELSSYAEKSLKAMVASINVNVSALFSYFIKHFLLFLSLRMWVAPRRKWRVNRKFATG